MDIRVDLTTLRKPSQSPKIKANTIERAYESVLKNKAIMGALKNLASK